MASPSVSPCSTRSRTSPSTRANVWFDTCLRNTSIERSIGTPLRKSEASCEYVTAIVWPLTRPPNSCVFGLAVVTFSGNSDWPAKSVTASR